MIDDDPAILARLVDFLANHPAVADKVTIHQAYAPAQGLAGEVRVGDDCAAIADGDGWLLFAAEGMLASFVAADPWFAGYSAVMVNLSDVAAMGGWPLAIVDVLWTPGLDRSTEIWEGMSAASRAYEMPGGRRTHHDHHRAGIVHSSRPRFSGKARKLISSFDAQPGDDLLMVIDLRGSWRGDKPFWNASVAAPAERLQSDLRLRPELAETGWCRAGKDVSNGGIVGTLAMLLECSGVGAELWLDQLPRPADAEFTRWLIAFPSFGYLLSVAPENTPNVTAHFAARGITCAPVGRVTASPSLVLGYGTAQAELPGAAASHRQTKSP